MSGRFPYDAVCYVAAPASVWLHSKDQSSEASQTFSNRRISARSSLVQPMPGNGTMAISVERAGTRLVRGSRPLALLVMVHPYIGAHVDTIEDLLAPLTQISDQPVDVRNLVDFKP